MTGSSRPCNTAGAPCSTVSEDTQEGWGRGSSQKAAYLRMLILHDIEDGASSNVRHDHPQLSLMNERAVQREHVGVVLLSHSLSFSNDFFLQDICRSSARQGLAALKRT